MTGRSIFQVNGKNERKKKKAAAKFIQRDNRSIDAAKQFFIQDGKSTAEQRGKKPDDDSLFEGRIKMKYEANPRNSDQAEHQFPQVYPYAKKHRLKERSKKANRRKAY